MVNLTLYIKLFVSAGGLWVKYIMLVFEINITPKFMFFLMFSNFTTY